MAALFIFGKLNIARSTSLLGLPEHWRRFMMVDN